MLNNHKIILDNFCELEPMVRPYRDGDFYDLSRHEFVPGAVYVISRQQYALNKRLIATMAKEKQIKPILCNPAEGSESMFWLYKNFGLDELSQEVKTSVITGGDLPAEIDHFYYEFFLPQILDFDKNVQSIKEYHDNFKLNRPYKFLFLNGRMRVHRKYLLEHFSHIGLLDQALWSNLDDGPTYRPYVLRYEINEENVIPRSFPIHYLPREYEVDRYRDSYNSAPVPAEIHLGAGPGLYAKYHLFQSPGGSEWGEIYLEARPYLDTYFSLVTETVYHYPHSFRTEKIWKPIAIGHPWIAVTNAGFYRDIHNLGFRTFGHLIDESFDSIDDPQRRIERIAAVVEDLCKQNLDEFAVAARDICVYNQQLQAELRPKIREEFPARFEQFLNERFGI